MNGLPNMCAGKASMDSVTMCWKLKWYCHDPWAQANVLDMRESACHGDDWGSIGCCYSGDNGAGCDRADLLAVSFYFWFQLS